MPPRFTWHAADVWVPRPLDRNSPPTQPGATRNFQARLRPGVTLHQAETELSLLAARRAKDHPDAYPSKFRMQVVNVIEYTVGPFSTVLYIALAAVLMLLLIACCNVAKMLLARKRASARDAWRPGNHGGRQPNVCRDLFPRHRSHRDSFFASRRRQLGTRLDRRCSRWPGWFKT
jgi:hypothetical protein